MIAPKRAAHVILRDGVGEGVRAARRNLGEDVIACTRCTNSVTSEQSTSEVLTSAGTVNPVDRHPGQQKRHAGHVCANSLCQTS